MDDFGDRRSSNPDFEGPYIGEEERIRHDALFYSQNPEDGLLLSGERARSLFIKSKLPLPELSKIWKLADVTRDNMLDEGEFAVAVHLIQRRLCGFDIPESIPSEWRPDPRPLLVIKQANNKEIEAYEVVFGWLQLEDGKFQNSETILKFLGTSGLRLDVLSKIWDLSDIDRDGKINKDEFFIALHMTRFCVNNQSDLKDSVDILSILPKKVSGESIHEKRRRRTEFQTEMRKLTSIKDKLQSELANAEKNENEAAKTKIQFELDKASKDLENLIKKETALRQEIAKMNLQTSVTTDIEVMRPFDRSFLMKRQSCGADYLKQMKYEPGKTVFSENVTPEIFVGDNIFDFARNLPVNPYATSKRRGSKSPLTETPEENHIKSLPSKSGSSNDEHSSNDESDSLDIGIKRRRRSRSKKSERDRLTKREPVSDRKIRSLSEAISDIAARNEAAKKEMDFRMVRSQSEAERSSEGSTTESSGEDKVTAKKDAYKRRSKSAMELFNKLFSSDSDATSDRESPTKRRSIKSLQKSPWNERKENVKHSSSENESQNNNGKGKDEKSGLKDLKVKTKRDKESLKTDENERPNSGIEKKAKGHNTQKNFERVDDFEKFNGKAKRESASNGSGKPLEVNSIRKDAKFVNDQNVYNQELTSREVKGNSHLGREIFSSNDSDEVEIVPLKLKPIDANGFNEFEVTSSKGHEPKKGLNSEKRGNRIEEEAVAPTFVPVDERVANLIDLLEETSCDSIEEERSRRRLSEVENQGDTVARSYSEMETREQNSVNEITGKFELAIKSSHLQELSSHSSQNEYSTNDETGTSAAESSDGGSLKTKSANEKEAVGDEETPKKRKKKVLRTKSGHIVRSKSLYGLRSSSDPNRLSYVEECEWLDTLVQVELETIERRKKAEEEAAKSPKEEPKERPQYFSRSETIDEGSLNLYDSRQLVKSLMDMELEGRKSKEETIKLRENNRSKDKDALERRKSMPVGKEILKAAEAGISFENEQGKNISTHPDTFNQERQKAEHKNDGDQKFTGNKKGVPTSLNQKVESKEIGKASRKVLKKGTEIDTEEPLLSEMRQTLVSSMNHEDKAKQVEANQEKVGTKREKAEDKREKVEAKQEKVAMKRENAEAKNKKNDISESLHHNKSKSLHHQSSDEEAKPLKNIKAFKEIFEEKSTTGRPVDNYNRSLSIEVSPVGLSRSKSLGEGLNRPSEDSKHIKVIEKQPSLEKKDHIALTDGIRSKDVVFYEEAKQEMERKKSLEESRHLEKINTRKKSEENMNDKVSEKIEIKSTTEEESVPHFKKIGEFKQLFEMGVGGDEKGTRVHVPVAKKDIFKEEEKSKEEQIVVSANKESNRHGNKEVPRKNHPTKSTNTEPEISKKKAETKIQQNKHEDEQISPEQSESIPSIKDKLAMFRTTFDQGAVRREKKEIRRIRPKSFHGSTYVDANDNDETIVREKTGANAIKTIGKTVSLKEDSISDIGEWMLHGTVDTQKKGSVKNDMDANLSSEVASMKPTLRKVTERSKPSSNATQKVEQLEKNDTNGEESNTEVFSYSKFVKDDRIRKELEEQEAREQEVRARLGSNNLDTEYLKQSPKQSIEVSKEHPPSSPKLSTPKLEKRAVKQVAEEHTRDGPDKAKGKNGTEDVRTSNGQSDYLAHVQNDRVRREIEEQERRDQEFRQHVSGKPGQSLQKEQNTVKRQGEKGILSDKPKSKEDVTEIDAKRLRGLATEIKTQDSNGNFVPEAALENKGKHTTSVSRESLKSRKMPSKIELELEEERRREQELEEEKQRREEEKNKILEEEKKKNELIEAENKRIQEEELAKQNAVLEEKMKRQERTRGLRALFETS